VPRYVLLNEAKDEVLTNVVQCADLKAAKRISGISDERRIIQNDDIPQERLAVRGDPPELYELPVPDPSWDRPAAKALAAKIDDGTATIRDLMALINLVGIANLQRVKVKRKASAREARIDELRGKAEAGPLSAAEQEELVRKLAGAKS